MPYIKIWIHLIWATKYRKHILGRDCRIRLFSHIRENARSKGIHIDFINGYIDHVHALISLKNDQTISKVTQLIKGESSHWANENLHTSDKFEWQDEYIAVSVSNSLVDVVREYIKNQESHHQIKCFSEEYNELIEICTGKNNKG
jgi:REP element-mobilizing transposase RayT